MMNSDKQWPPNPNHPAVYPGFVVLDWQYSLKYWTEYILAIL